MIRRTELLDRIARALHEHDVATGGSPLSSQEWIDEAGTALKALAACGAPFEMIASIHSGLPADSGPDEVARAAWRAVFEPEAAKAIEGAAKRIAAELQAAAERHRSSEYEVDEWRAIVDAVLRALNTPPRLDWKYSPWTGEPLP